MIPTESFAQKRAEAETLIRQHAPARLQELLIALLRPAIALSATRTDDALIPLGASKFGGAPDVPPNFEWPMWNDKPLGFLAQINLEEVAPFDVENQLPPSGMLSFFYDLIDQPWGSHSDKGSWAVHLFETGNLRRAEEQKMEREINCCSLQFSSRVDLPDYVQRGRSLTEVGEPFGSYYEIEKGREQPDKRHQLLGTAMVLQGEMQSECELKSKGQPYPEDDEDEDGLPPRVPGEEDWTLLFQVDSDKSLEVSWGDVGFLYFWIRRQDLAARQFENCWIQLQCY